MEETSKFNILGNKKLVLGSASPRRRELIAGLGLEVRLLEPIEVDESFPARMQPEDVPVYVSQKKAHPYQALLGADDILLTADTVVINRGEVVGKPHDRREALAMLRNLSARTHHVVTGVTLSTLRRQLSFNATTEVEFAELMPEEIEYYVDIYRPYDKAGAYGIQEWIGQVGIKSIRGDFYNVMGLPLRELYEHLRRLSVKHY